MRRGIKQNCHGSVPTIQLGLFQSKALKIGIMLTKFSMQVGIKWPCHYGLTKFLAYKNHGIFKWAGCKLSLHTPWLQMGQNNLVPMIGKIVSILQDTVGFEVYRRL